MKITIAVRDSNNPYNYKLIESEVENEETLIGIAQNNSQEIYKTIEKIDEDFHPGVTQHMSEQQLETLDMTKKRLYGIAWEVGHQADKYMFKGI